MPSSGFSIQGWVFLVTIHRIIKERKKENLFMSFYLVQSITFIFKQRLPYMCLCLLETEVTSRNLIVFFIIRAS